MENIPSSNNSENQPRPGVLSRVLVPVINFIINNPDHPLTTTLDGMIAPIVKSYTDRQTAVGEILGDEGHSGTTSSSFHEHLLGNGSLLGKKITTWQDLGVSEDQIISQRMVGDGQILVLELTRRLLEKIGDYLGGREIIFLINGLIATQLISIYSGGYGPSIAQGYTTIGDPSDARYGATYTINGDMSIVDEYLQKHRGESFTVYGPDGERIDRAITCSGDAALICIDKELVDGYYEVYRL